MPTPDLGIVGKSGMRRWGSGVDDEFLPELRGPKGRKVYREMSEQDPTVGAILFAIEMLCRRVSWHVEAGGPDEADAEAASFLESCLSDMSLSWEDTLSEILTFLPFGWSWVETVYKFRDGPDQDDPTRRSKYSDGRIGWRKLAGRAQESLDGWEFDDDGGIKGMRQRDPSRSEIVVIPIEKSLHFRTTARKGNPEGRSILRSAYRPWYFKQNIETIEAIGIERDLAGLPVIYAPPAIMGASATSDQQAIFTELKRIVTSIRRDEQEGLIIPNAFDDKGNRLYELKLLSTGGSRQFDTDKTITRYDTRIAMTALADFILLGHEAVGSFALSSSKTSLFGYALGAWLDVIADVFTSYAFPRLLRLNQMPTSSPPKLRHGDVESADLAELGAYIEKLANAGAALFPNAELERYLLTTAGLPAPVEEE